MCLSGSALTVLEPMLDAETIVPNGGTLRFFPNAHWESGVNRRITKVFSESPYRRRSALCNHRCGWNALEGRKDEYLFDRTLEPCVRERSRITIGLAWMCGGGLRGNTNVVWNADGA